MTLPARRHFDTESAAEYLGCSVSDLRYYLDEGLLRLAFPTTDLWAIDAILHEELSQELQAAMYLLPDLPGESDFKNIKRKSRDKSRCPEYLYLSGYHRKNALADLNGSGRPIFYFENIKGQLINIWLDGSLGSLRVYLREDGGLSDAILSREELDRFSKSSKDGTAKANSSDKSKDIDQYIAPLYKPSEVALLIVEYANKYYSERKKHPNALSLGKYLSEHASREGFKIRTEEEMRKGKNADEKKEYDFNGYGLTARSLDDRLRKYRKN